MKSADASSQHTAYYIIYTHTDTLIHFEDISSWYHKPDIRLRFTGLITSFDVRALGCAAADQTRNARRAFEATIRGIARRMKYCAVEYVSFALYSRVSFLPKMLSSFFFCQLVLGTSSNARLRVWRDFSFANIGSRIYRSVYYTQDVQVYVILQGECLIILDFIFYLYITNRLTILRFF